MGQPYLQLIWVPTCKCASRLLTPGNWVLFCCRYSSEKLPKLQNNFHQVSELHLTEKAQFRHHASAVLNSIAITVSWTVARQKHDSDSDVMPESYQIQDFLKPRNSSTQWNAIPPKYINIIYEFCLARQKHDV